MRPLAVAAALVMVASARGQSVELRRLDIRAMPTLELELRLKDGKGQDMGGVPATDFDVRLDGVPVEGIAVAAAGQGAGKSPAPVFFLVDRSGDLSAAGSHALRKAASLLAESLPTGTPIAVYSFDAKLREECALEEDRELVKQAIVNISPGMGTSYVEPLGAVARRAAATDATRAIVLFLVHAEHYPGSPPAPGRAYSLPGHATPIYPVVLQDGGDAELPDVVSRVVRRLAQGLPGIYRLTLTAPFGADGELHTLSVGLRAGGPQARCRFRAMKGPATSPSSLLESELRRGTLVPWQGALVGALLGGIAILILGPRSGPVRLTPLMRLCVVGGGAVMGAMLALLAFPSV